MLLLYEMLVGCFTSLTKLLSGMLIKEIEADATLDIRHRVLWPDKPREFSLVDGDQSATHYGLFHNDELIGVASVFEIAGSVRLRKFAIDTAYQRRGYGAALLHSFLV